MTITRRHLWLSASVAMAGGLLYVCGCSTLSYVGLGSVGVRIGDPFVITTTPAKLGFGILSHPALMKLTDQRVMVTYFIAGDGGYGGIAPCDWPAYTDDYGKTWKFDDPMAWPTGKTADVCTSVKRGEKFQYNYGYVYDVAVETNGHRIAQERDVYRNRNGIFHASAIESWDGINWSGPFDLIYDVPPEFHLATTSRYESAIYTSVRAVVLSNGNVLSVGCARRNGGEQFYSSHAFIRKPGERRWEHFSVIATAKDAPWGNQGPGEPGIEILPNGDLLCIMRTGMFGAGSDVKDATPMLVARSRDGGVTWSHSQFSAQGVMPKLLQMSNGVLVCAFGRPGNNLRFSTDNGHSWTERALSPADAKTSGYVDIVEISPGRLLAVYDFFNTTLQKVWLWEPPDEQNILMGRIVDVSR